MNSGTIYALVAALLNASVGSFSTGAFSAGLSPENVAFYKCLLAFCVLSIWVILIPEQRRQCFALFSHSHKIALMALSGIFVLYYFETTAYQFSAIAITVFILQGVSTITTFVGSKIILKIHHSLTEWLSMLLAVIGLIFLYSSTNVFSQLNVGTIFATLAGVGYGLFLVLSKKVRLPFQGVPLLWWLLLFGCLFLFIPFYFGEPELPTFEGWIYIACLGLIGTIGGFYCTIKALLLLSASKVQLCELCEPIFACMLGLIFFKQWLTIPDVMGALFIFTAIYMLNRPSQTIEIEQIREESKC